MGLSTRNAVHETISHVIEPDKYYSLSFLGNCVPGELYSCALNIVNALDVTMLDPTVNDHTNPAMIESGTYEYFGLKNMPYTIRRSALRSLC
jgi:hypothetical protein